MRPQLNVRFLRDSCLPGLEVALVRESAHVFPNHSHDQFAFGLMEAGGNYCLGPRRSASLVAPGHLALINPGQVHSGVPPQGARASYRMFYLEPEIVRGVAAEAGLGRLDALEFARLVVRLPEATAGLLRLSHLVIHGGDRLEKDSCLVEALTLLLARHGSAPARLPRPGREHRAVRLVQEHLAGHLEDKVALEELAGLAGLSRYHLLRVFKQGAGLTPHAFHTQMRVDRAKELARQGTPLAEVAAATGFVDQSHLTTTFRQFVGATPGQYAAGS